jgi:hypothetical protein
MSRSFALDPSRALLYYPEKIVAVYRGWEAFERANMGPQIIDFDLSSIDDVASFSSRREVLLVLEELCGQLDDNSHEGEFLRDKLRGSISYLRALMGQQIPFNEYLRHTLGIAPERFPDQEVDAIRCKVEDLLSSLKLDISIELSGQLTFDQLDVYPREMHHLGHEAFVETRDNNIPNVWKLKIDQVLLPFQGVEIRWAPKPNVVNRRKIAANHGVV